MERTGKPLLCADTPISKVETNRPMTQPLDAHLLGSEELIHARILIAQGQSKKWGRADPQVALAGMASDLMFAVFEVAAQIAALRKTIERGQNIIN